MICKIDLHNFTYCWTYGSSKSMFAFQQLQQLAQKLIGFTTLIQACGNDIPRPAVFLNLGLAFHQQSILLLHYARCACIPLISPLDLTTLQHCLPFFDARVRPSYSPLDCLISFTFSPFSSQYLSSNQSVDLPNQIQEVHRNVMLCLLIDVLSALN